MAHFIGGAFHGGQVKWSGVEFRACKNRWHLVDGWLRHVDLDQMDRMMEIATQHYTTVTVRHNGARVNCYVWEGDGKPWSWLAAEALSLRYLRALPQSVSSEWLRLNWF